MMMRLQEQLERGVSPSKQLAATVWFSPWEKSNDDQPAVSLLYAIRKDLKLEGNNGPGPRPRMSRSSTRDASQNSTRTGVTSANDLTSSWEGMNPNGASGPRANSIPRRRPVPPRSPGQKRSSFSPRGWHLGAPRQPTAKRQANGCRRAVLGRRPRNSTPGVPAVTRRSAGPSRYLRRETRRAVRRPVRRATLRPPNISCLLSWSCGPGLGSWCVCCSRRPQLVQFPRLLGRDQPYPHQVQWADEAVADAETSGAGDRIPKRHRPVVLQQDQRRR